MISQLSAKRQTVLCDKGINNETEKKPPETKETRRQMPSMSFNFEWESGDWWSQFMWCVVRSHGRCRKSLFLEQVCPARECPHWLSSWEVDWIKWYVGMLNVSNADRKRHHQKQSAKQAANGAIWVKERKKAKTTVESYDLVVTRRSITRRGVEKKTTRKMKKKAAGRHRSYHMTRGFFFALFSLVSFFVQRQHRQEQTPWS